MHTSPSTPAAVPDIDSDAVVAFTQDLVRLRTVNAAGATEVERPAAELVARLFTEFGWTYDVMEVAPGRPNTVAVIEGGGGAGPTLMFEGHIDVVTEGTRRTGASIRTGPRSATASCGGAAPPT